MKKTSPMTNELNGQKCSNCGTSKTPLWRRAPDGSLICNACGLYYKANNCHRPINLKRPPKLVKLEPCSGSEQGSCKGDGRCNGTGGAAACKGCPVFINRVIISSNEEIDVNMLETEQRRVKAEPDSGSPGDLETVTAHAEQSAVPVLDKKDTESVAIACSNCQTTITPLWRRNDLGEIICNACGLYYKLHGAHRPIKLKSKIIKRRKRLQDGSEGSPVAQAQAPAVAVAASPVKRTFEYASASEAPRETQIKLPHLADLELQPRGHSSHMGKSLSIRSLLNDDN